MAFKTLNDLGQIRGKKVLVRVDFNVPVEDGKVVDAYRIEKSLPTIKWLKEKGAKVLLMSHIELSPLEKKKLGANAGKPSLLPVAEYLKQYFPVTFAKDFFSSETKAMIDALPAGEVLLFENLRNDKGEEENDKSFVKHLAALAEIYVNDGFSVSHRAHASVVGIPEYLPSYAGLLMQSEVEHLSALFHPPHPFLFILGGAKFDTKLPLIQKFFNLAEHVFVGGALANNFFKEKGWNVGTSLLSEGNFPIKELLNDPRLLLPIDVEVKSDLGRSVKKPEEVLPTDSILDAGPATVEMLGDYIVRSKCVLWNGPLGDYEHGFTEPTHKIANMLAEGNAESIVGGGDTLAAIASTGVESKISFVSTGGGAMLDFLLDESLAGVEALKKAALREGGN